MLQCDELQKKQKLTAIWSEIETLQIIEMMKRSHQTFTQVLTKNLNNLRIVFIVSTMMKWSYHEIVLQKWRFSMSLKKYHDKIIREHREWIRDVEISFQNISWHFEKDEKKMRKRFCTAWFIWSMNQRNFDLIMKRLCLQLSRCDSILLTFF